MRRGERGLAVVWSIGLTGLLLTMLLVCGRAGALITAHRGVQSAADLTALAGATALRDGRDACATASAIAARNRGEVSECAVVGHDVLVEVRLQALGLLGRDAWLVARARAGPSGLSR